MPNKLLKENLKNRQLTIGSWISLGGSVAIAEIMANSGFDWIVVDLEHSTISIDQAGDLIRVIDLAGPSPLVRLTSNNEDQIKRVMDAGAHGIVVPMVNSVEDAMRAVSAMRYAPQGNRGVGLARAQKYGVGFKEYVEWQKQDSTIIVQIEHIDAIDHLQDIFSLPEVDGFIIGPYDLSCSMGIPGEFSNPRFLEVIELIRDLSRQLDKPGGVHIVEPDPQLLKQAISDGYHFIAYSVDIRMIDSVCRNGLNIKKDI